LWVPSAYIYGNPPNSTPMPSGSSGSNSGGGSQSVVQALRTAIIGQESGYNYKAVNPDSGALGFAQIMPFNIGPWSREALGYEITRAQFLNSPDLQLKIIDYKLNQYYQNAIAASGSDVDIAVRRVASAWYSGNPNLYANTRPQYSNGNQYPSIADYTLSVLAKFRQAYGSGSSNNSNNSNNSNSSNNAGLNLVNFTGSVMPPAGVARRNSPNFSDKNGKADPYGKVLSFDAWMYGETGTDYQLGTPDARWFRIAGTNEWVPSAYINGNPPNSNAMPGSGAIGSVTIGVTYNGRKAVNDLGWKNELEKRNKDFYSNKNPNLLEQSILGNTYLAHLALQKSWETWGWDDAADLLRFYLNANNGGVFKIDLDEAIRESSEMGRELVEDFSLNDVLEPIRQGFKSGFIGNGWGTAGHSDLAPNGNWLEALGGFHRRYEGSFSIDENNTITLLMKFFLKDVYDFDDFLYGLTGSHNLHKAGIVRAFETTGESSTYTWKFTRSGMILEKPQEFSSVSIKGALKLVP